MLVCHNRSGASEGRIEYGGVLESRRHRSDSAAMVPSMFDSRYWVLDGHPEGSNCGSPSYRYRSRDDINGEPASGAISSMKTNPSPSARFCEQLNVEAPAPSPIWDLSHLSRMASQQ